VQNIIDRIFVVVLVSEYADGPVLDVAVLVEADRSL